MDLIEDVDMTDLSHDDINASTLKKDLEDSLREQVASSSAASRGKKTLFVWGNTVNGELGLGGIEEHFVSEPRRLDFSSQIKFSK
jgi:alpha-tubulin suppressor-like RCC1 family protein